MNRHYPEPLPQIHPLPEYLVTGRTQRWYEEMKEAMQVPWVGVVAMAYAHYPAFFESLWQGARPLVGSVEFVRAGLALRRFVESEIMKLAPAPILTRLRELGYADREVDQIRGSVEVFSHGNFPYLLLATIVRMLLEGGQMTSGTDATPFHGRHAPETRLPLVLIEAHHADAPTRALYGDIMRTLRLPFVNTDYRALARWPTYFSRAWHDLKSAIAMPAYDTICDAVHHRVLQLVACELPNPGGLSATVLRKDADRDASVGEVLQVSRLFQWLLPGLVTNVAYLRAQLER